MMTANAPDTSNSPSAKAALASALEQLQSTLTLVQDLLNDLSPSADARDVQLEESVRSVAIGGARVELTEQQMTFFKLLLAADHPLSAREILDALYPTGARPDNQIVNVVISNLRKKLKPACGGCDPIETVRGVGYKLNQQVFPSATHDQPVSSHWRRTRSASTTAD